MMRGTLYRLLVTFCLATGTVFPAMAQEPAPESCAIPDTILTIDAVLPKVRAALRMAAL